MKHQHISHHFVSNRLCFGTPVWLIQKSIHLGNFPDGLVVKNPPANAGDTGDVGLISGSGRFPWRRKWQPTQVFLPGKFHRQRSLVGYSPWGLQRIGQACTVVQWLGLCVFTAQGPGQGTKILLAMKCSQKKKKKSTHLAKATLS